MTKELFGSAFPAASYEAWWSLVEKSLKGASFEKALSTKLLEGISVKPLYDREGMPGEAFVRSIPLPSRRADLTTRIDAPLVAGATEQIKSDAEGGGDSGIVVLDRFTRLGKPRTFAKEAVCADGLSLYSSEELGLLLQAARSAKLPLIFDVGVNALGLGALIAARPSEERGLVAGLWCDPLATLKEQGPSVSSWSRLFDEAAQVSSDVGPVLPGKPLFISDGRIVHEAGASAVQELSYILSHALTLFREFEARGIPPLVVAERLNIVIGVGPDFFLEMAKARALRVLWQNIAEPLGGNIPLHVTAVTARWNRTRDDPHTNLLRATSESLSALCGGVDRLQVLPFLLRGDGEETLARRMSLSVHHILHEEALLGHVKDPVGGSYYLESLTTELCKKAWGHFQGIESSGGLRSVLENGSFQAEVAVLRELRAQAVSSGISKLVGLNAFRDASELPRLQAYDVEALRLARAAEFLSQPVGSALTSFSEMVGLARAGVPLTVIAEHARVQREKSSPTGPPWNPAPMTELCLQRLVDGACESKGGAR